jgi:choline dehydrogenase-like flavoprotein
MLIDARRNLPRTGLDCDICIVGGGPAGLTLARELDDGRRSICLVEGGGLAFEQSSQALFAGQSDGDGYPYLQATRMAALGGSTHFWAGWCRPLDPIDFERREEFPSSGWPISRSDLDPFYRQANEILELGPFDYDPLHWERAASTHRLPIPAEDIEAILFRRSSIHFGARRAAELRRSQRVRAYLHASVLRLQFSNDGRRVTSVDLAVHGARTGFEIKAKTVVLAAGGIENARLLLLSGTGLTRGPANEHGIVGRYFTEHIYVDGGVYMPAARRSLAFHFPRSVSVNGTPRTARGAYAPSPTAMRRERLLNAALYFRPAYEADPVFADSGVQALLACWDMVRGRAVPHEFPKNALHAAGSPLKALRALYLRCRNRDDSDTQWRLRALVECAADPDNCVELSHERDAFGRPTARVRWQARDADLRSCLRAHALFDGALRRAGLGSLKLLPDEPERWRAAMQPALHHLGTTRMHDNPALGVVDRNSRAHGVDNLYIAGGSVFTTGGFANPTLTILALALRLAKHLKEP